MRLIDADALIREICRDQCERKYEDCDGMCQMVAYVENTPTIGDWISVEERLPERGTRCLIYAAQGKAHYTSIANFNGYFGLSGRRAYWKVTHWMPIPEPPTGDKS